MSDIHPPQPAKITFNGKPKNTQQKDDDMQDQSVCIKVVDNATIKHIKKNVKKARKSLKYLHEDDAIYRARAHIYHVGSGKKEVCYRLTIGTGLNYDGESINSEIAYIDYADGTLTDTKAKAHTFSLTKIVDIPKTLGSFVATAEHVEKMMLSVNECCQKPEGCSSYGVGLVVTPHDTALFFYKDQITISKATIDFD